MLKRRIVLLVLLHAIVSSNGEPPVNANSGNGLVNQRLLNRVADIISKGGDGSVRAGDDGTQNNEGPSVVDQQLLDRIARIISQNEGQLSWAHKSHSKHSDSTGRSSRQNSDQQVYGAPGEVPEEVKDLAGPQFELSPPMAVPRIAAFDINEENENAYIAAASNQHETFSDSYADNRNRHQGGESIALENPQNAHRIASFDIQGETPPAPFTPPQGGRGFFTNTK